MSNGFIRGYADLTGFTVGNFFVDSLMDDRLPEDRDRELKRTRDTSSGTSVSAY
jgi:hypothetical protein